MANQKNGFPIKGSHRLRIGRWSQPGESYFITTSTFKRQAVFADANCCQIVFDAIDWLEREERLTCYCSVIMPDHIHMVMELGTEQSLSKVMQSLKRYTARKINELNGQKGHVWQNQYYDRLIRREGDLRNIVLYCYENPVRKNIVSDARNYPFWKCKFEIE